MFEYQCQYVSISVVTDWVKSILKAVFELMLTKMTQN